MAQQKRIERSKNKSKRLRDHMDLKYDKIHNLPKNCTY